MDELKQCPFCNGSVSMGESKDHGVKYWFIVCFEDSFFMTSKKCAANAPLDIQNKIKKDLIEA